MVLRLGVVGILNAMVSANHLGTSRPMDDALAFSVAFLWQLISKGHHIATRPETQDKLET